MSTAVQAGPEERHGRSPAAEPCLVVDGKFLRQGAERFLVKGVAYGTFAPDADGHQFPCTAQIGEDFRMMAARGINTVRTYTPPPRELPGATSPEFVVLVVTATGWRVAMYGTADP